MYFRLSKSLLESLKIIFTTTKIHFAITSYCSLLSNKSVNEKYNNFFLVRFLNPRKKAQRFSGAPKFQPNCSCYHLEIITDRLLRIALTTIKISLKYSCGFIIRKYLLQSCCFNLIEVYIMYSHRLHLLNSKSICSRQGSD